jgi:hypothetical protein
LDTQITIQLYNNLGQLVLTKTFENLTESLSLDGLLSGIYYFSIPTSTGTHQGKIIKK